MQILIFEFRLQVYSTRYNQHNTNIHIDGCSHLACDLMDHFNLGLHITQSQ